MRLGQIHGVRGADISIRTRARIVARSHEDLEGTACFGIENMWETSHA